MKHLWLLYLYAKILTAKPSNYLFDLAVTCTSSSVRHSIHSSAIYPSIFLNNFLEEDEYVFLSAKEISLKIRNPSLDDKQFSYLIVVLATHYTFQ